MLPLNRCQMLRPASRVSGAPIDLRTDLLAKVRAIATKRGEHVTFFQRNSKDRKSVSMGERISEV